MACKGCKMGFFESIRKFHDFKKCLKIINNHGIRNLEVKCPECNEIAKLSEDNSHWYCQNGHDFEYLVSSDDWLNSLYSSPSKHCIFMTLYLQTDPPDQDSITYELEISRTLTSSWVTYVHKVLQDWCLHYSAQKLGGLNITVEMTEAELENNNDNGRSIEGTWVFSAFERNSRKFFFEVVPNRSSATLIKVIRERICPGTKILLTSQMACGCLQEEGFNLLKEDYDMNWLEPRIGIYTQNVPSSIPEDNQMVHCMSGYLANSLFRKHVSDYYDRIHYFLMAVNVFDRINRGLPIENNVDNNIDNNVDNIDNDDDSDMNNDVDSDMNNDIDSDVDNDVDSEMENNVDNIDNNVDSNKDNNVDNNDDYVDDDNSTTWAAFLVYYLSCFAYSIVASILLQRLLMKYNMHPFINNNNDTSSS